MSESPTPESGAHPAKRSITPLIVAAGVALLIAAGVAAALVARDDSHEPDRLGAPTENPVALPSGDAPAEDVPVPDVELELWEEGTTTLDDLGGRPAVVNFWASWCAPCIAEMPDLEEVYQAYDGQVQFLGVNRADSRELAEALAEQTGVTYPLATDPGDELLAAVGGLTMPTTLLIDENGIIVRVHSGALTSDALTGAIEEELGVEPPS